MNGGGPTAAPPRIRPACRTRSPTGRCPPPRGGGARFRTVLADPPWRFQNRTGKMAPEHGRLARYGTMSFADIESLPVADVCADKAHLYLWVPNALLAEGLATMAAWGFEYKTNLVWFKT